MTEELVNRTISILYRYNQRFLTQRLDYYALPIDVGFMPALVQVYRFPGITQGGISSITGLDKGTTARTLTQLEDAGFVMRQTDENDRRINHIFPTKKAVEIEERVFLIVRELHEILYQGFEDSELLQTIALLERMKCNMHDYLKGS